MNRDNHEKKLIVLRPCLLSTSAFIINQTIQRIGDGPVLLHFVRHALMNSIIPNKFGDDLSCKEEFFGFIQY
jgi:hypothetical protein